VNHGAEPAEQHHDDRGGAGEAMVGPPAVPFSAIAEPVAIENNPIDPTMGQ
jgi:hypothetical protein